MHSNKFILLNIFHLIYFIKYVLLDVFRHLDTLSNQLYGYFSIKAIIYLSAKKHMLIFLRRSNEMEMTTTAFQNNIVRKAKNIPIKRITPNK